MSWRQLALRLSRLSARGLSTSSCCRAQCLPALHSSLHGFQVQRIVRLEELDASAVSLSHTSGASYLHVARDDPNNVFAVGFRTPARDNSGVSHILEHMTLCGSERYPTRDPFFKMLNRSLATFMNAFTASDWTMYPFSTCNQTDFVNLMQIYLDAVFCPRLEELDFLQEGWRLEHQSPQDRSSPVVFKGVVYNEMKGALSDRHRYLAEKVQNALLPSSCYRYCSGGDPTFIPQLSWQKLRQFHAEHYNPANCFLFSYGDMPLQPHLQRIHDQYLSNAPSSSSFSPITPMETRWQNPAHQLLSCRPDPLVASPDRQNCVAVSFLQGDVTEPLQNMLLGILGSLLVDGPNAPFYRSLIESGLAQDYSPHCTGFEASLRDTLFCVGVQGVKDEDKQKVIDIIDKTIEETVERGFEEQRVEATLHQMELSLRRQSSSFGLGLLMHVVAPWLHRADPISHLCFSDLIVQCRQRLAENPQLLQQLVKQHLLDNPHKLVTVLEPDDLFQKNIDTMEKELLNSRVQPLHEYERKKVFDVGLQLLERQKDPRRCIDCLPVLQLSDIADSLPRYQPDIQIINQVPVHLLCQPTNGICYFRALINVSHLPIFLKPLLPLFCQLLTQMGTQHSDFRQLDRRVRLSTGGLSACITLSDSISEPGRFEEALLLQSHCLQRHTATMMGLWRELFLSVSFGDLERLFSLLQMAAADLGNDVSSSGHLHAMSVASSSICESARLHQLYTGLQQLKFLKSLVEQIQPEIIASKMQLIAKSLLSKLNGARCAISCSEGGEEAAMKGLNSLLESVAADSVGADLSDFSVTPDFSSSSLKTAVRLGLPVQYAALCLPTVPYTHPDFAPLRVLARCVSLSYLHPSIREQGGAYGSGARISSGGLWHYYSYRDPSGMASLRTFSGTAEFVKKHNFDSVELSEAKLGVFQAVDAPVIPADRGMRQFISGISDDQFALHRQQLKEVTVEDLRRVSAKYLDEPSILGKCLLGAVKEDDHIGDDWVVTDG